METNATPSERQARQDDRVRWVCQAVAVAGGLALGYDIGLRMSSSSLMGLVMAVNAAFFCALAAAAAVEPALRLWHRAARKQGGR